MPALADSAILAPFPSRYRERRWRPCSYGLRLKCPWGKHTIEIKSLVQAFGTPDAHGPSYSLVEEYRGLLRKAVGRGPT